MKIRFSPLSATPAGHRLFKTVIFSLFFLLPISLIVRVVQAGNTTVNTTVTVGNSAPAFTVNATEITSSDTTDPTTVGTTVAFTATATDGNGEAYYLAICKSSSVTPVNGSAPTCPGGNWCITTSTTSGNAATCTYTALQADAETNDWYPFVCDGNASSAQCSSVGSAGTNASPFQVNHPPSFSAIGNTTPINPGATVSWTTGVGTTDADGVGGSDTVKLVICKTTGVATAACDGGAADTWCASSLVSGNPSCSIGISVPTADTSYNAFAYVFDSHNIGSSSANQGIGKSFVVNNVGITLSSMTINGGVAITLAESPGTAPVVLGATVTDNNGCSDISTVTADLFRSGVGQSSCDVGGEANNNNCYPAISCSTSDCGAGAAATYTCTTYLKSYADPTDAGTLYAAQNWYNLIKAVDDNSAVGSSATAGVELSSKLALDVGTSIQYGSLSVGQSNDPLDKTTTVTATGNVGLDQDLSGTSMSSGADTIPVTAQRYSLAASTAYNSGTTLTTSAVGSSLSVVKATTDTGTTKPTYWGIKIPLNTVPGSYSGQVFVTAVMSASDRW